MLIWQYRSEGGPFIGVYFIYVRSRALPCVAQ